MDEDLFADVDFSQQQQAGPDEIIRLLGGVGGGGKQQFTPMANPPKKDNKEAAARVNAGTKDTGGRAVVNTDGSILLTNLDSSGQRMKSVTVAEVPAFGSASRVATPIYETLAKLKQEKDVPAADALYANLQQTLVGERVRLEGEAQRFAESKVGTTGLEGQLRQAELADKSDPMWYPGVGDSPITAGIRAQLGQSRALANAEAKNFLDSNLTYQTTKTVEADARVEYNRVKNTQALQERTTAAASERNIEKKARQDEILEIEALSITPEKLMRAKIIDPASFTDPTTNQKVIAMKIDKGGSKEYKEALDAPSTKLPVLALRGNGFATTLVARKEAEITGQTEEEVLKSIAATRADMAKPGFEERVFMSAYTDPKEATKQLKDFRLLKVSKKDESSEHFANLAVQYMAAQKTVKFKSDVGSWGSLDLDLNLAIQEAKRKAGKPTFDNVMTSFITDKEGRELEGPLLLQRLSKFKQLTIEAARKHNGSGLGMPAYEQLTPVIDARANSIMGGIIRRAAESVRGVVRAGLDMIPPEATAIGNQMADQFPPLYLARQAATPPAQAIDPSTGRPFGAN